MEMNDMILVSVDDHVCEPPDMWDGVLSPEWKSRAPKLVTRNDGTNAWVFEGQQIPNIGLNAVAGRPPEEYGMEPTSLSQLRKGCWDVDARIDDMNVNGVLGSLCFPSVPGFCGELFGRNDDKELARVMIQAYNDWHIDAWCGAHPGRFIPLAIPMMWDPKLLADEVRRVAKKGCHAISFADTPTGLGHPSLFDDYWEPFWKACSDEGTVICMHIGSGTGMALNEMNAPIEIMITSTPITLFNVATELVYSDFLRRYPDLKFALSEGGVGWIPYFLERADYVYEHHSAWTHQDFGDKKPSEVFREHIFNCFIDDKAGKPVGIHKFIGRRPIAAFGNSDGDLQMLQWVAPGKSTGFGLIVHHTDAEREWAYDRESKIGHLDKALDEAQSRGWTIVDMKKDWKQVFFFQAP